MPIARRRSGKVHAYSSGKPRKYLGAYLDEDTAYAAVAAYAANRPLPPSSHRQGCPPVTAANGMTVAKAASLLQIHRSTLYRRAKANNMPMEEYLGTIPPWP